MSACAHSGCSCPCTTVCWIHLDHRFLLAGCQAHILRDSRAAPPPLLDAVASAEAEAKPPLPPVNAVASPSAEAKPPLPLTAAVASASAEAMPPLLKASASALAPAGSSGQQLHCEREHKRQDPCGVPAQRTSRAVSPTGNSHPAHSLAQLDSATAMPGTSTLLACICGSVCAYQQSRHPCRQMQSSLRWHWPWLCMRQ